MTKFTCVECYTEKDELRPRGFRGRNDFICRMCKQLEVIRKMNSKGK
jgi:hypothetical protein